VASLALVGAALGIEAMLAIAAFSIPLCATTNFVAQRLGGGRQRSVPFTLAVPVVTAFYLIFWSQFYLATKPYLPGTGAITGSEW
jgi:hypothetical protein